MRALTILGAPARPGAAPVLAALLLFAAQPARGTGVVVEFLLVPQRWIGADDVAEHALEDGQVLLFQEGNLSPELVVPAGTPVPMAPGAWFGIATAPGYVSAGLEALSLPPEDASQTSQPVILPVVEACEVRLAGGGEGPGGAERLDFFSLERGTVFPHDPGGEPPLRLPAGSFMASEVQREGLVALAGPFDCRPGAAEELPPLSPPGPGRRSFLIHLALPPDTGLDLDRLTAGVHFTAGEAPRPPTAVSRGDSQITLFFLDLPASGDQTLRVEYPELPVFTLTLPPPDRAVADLGLHFLVPPFS